MTPSTPTPQAMREASNETQTEAIEAWKVGPASVVVLLQSRDEEIARLKTAITDCGNEREAGETELDDLEDERHALEEERDTLRAENAELNMQAMQREGQWIEWTGEREKLRAENERLKKQENEHCKMHTKLELELQDELTASREMADRLANHLRAILDADCRGQGTPFAEAMKSASHLLSDYQKARGAR